MAERVQATAQRGDLPLDPPNTPEIQHCWVSDRHGRLPGLLLGWRRVGDSWEGRVVRAAEDVDGWVVVEEWLPAGFLEPT